MRERRTFEDKMRCLDDPPPQPPAPVQFPDLETHLKERRLPMVTLNTVLMVLAFVCLVHVGWLGLALWVLAILIGARG